MITEMLKLEETCSCCSGSGEVVNIECMELNNKFEMETKRLEAGGMPRHEAMDKIEAVFKAEGLELPWDMTDIFPCIECDGKGTVLTAEGEQLIKFFRKYL